MKSFYARGRSPPRRCATQPRDLQCTPGYYNNEGKAAELNGQNGFYGGGSVEFFRILREWREEGGLKGLELS